MCTGLGGLHDRVAGRMEVFRCVLILGGIAAADVAARKTEPQFHPPVSTRQTLFAAFRIGRNRADLLNV
jgi:hypothetical protein